MSTTSSHGFTARAGWFIDRHGRHSLLRGVNLSGASKVPFTPNCATHLGVDFQDWANVSFIGRPFPLDEADEHLGRIAHWGFNVLRLLVTWEAIEHAGPGRYDEAYLDYIREVVKKAREHGLLVFIDPHHDVWSRWTGGDGAPYWCFDWAGLLPERFVEAEAVALNAADWPQSAIRVPVATMSTLFMAGDTFCPELRGLQTRLQDHYINAVCAVVERVADLDNVIGYDSFNEPTGGYVGRDKDLGEAKPVGTRSGSRAFSAVDYLAAADGIPVRHEDGHVLNSSGVSIWRDGCPWRRAGFWGIDAEGKPTLTKPSYFSEVDGQPVTRWQYIASFIKRFRDAIRKVHPDCFVFIEGMPFDLMTPWDDPDPLICNARHWYDVVMLATNTFDPEAYPTFRSETVSGVEAIADEFKTQLSALQTVTREHMGNPPMLLGEFGILYTINDLEAYRTGDYSKHEIALDANYRALDALLLNSTQWNYTPDNSHEHGDQWNHEDLSIFSRDDQNDPSDPDSGGRAARGFCRPYVRRAAGRPLSMSFDMSTGLFELEIERDSSVTAPTEVYVPRLHYPNGVTAEVSSGTTTHDPASQVLTWTGHGESRPARLRLTPK